jgi:hypothetical protein
VEAIAVMKSQVLLAADRLADAGLVGFSVTRGLKFWTGAAAMASRRRP